MRDLVHCNGSGLCAVSAVEAVAVAQGDAVEGMAVGEQERGGEADEGWELSVEMLQRTVATMPMQDKVIAMNSVRVDMGAPTGGSGRAWRVCGGRDR